MRTSQPVKIFECAVEASVDFLDKGADESHIMGLVEHLIGEKDSRREVIRQALVKFKTEKSPAAASQVSELLEAILPFHRDDKAFELSIIAQRIKEHHRPRTQVTLRKDGNKVLGQ